MNRVLCGVLVIAACGLGVAGCAPAGPDTAPVREQETPAETPPSVIHLVSITDARAPDPGEIAAEPWKHSIGRIAEHWITHGGQPRIVRFSLTPEATQATDEPYAPPTTLVANGISYALTDYRPSFDATQATLGVSETDSPETDERVVYEFGFDEGEPLTGGDPDFYRKAVESGDASVTATGSEGETETITLTIERTSSYEAERGVTLTVTVRAEDYLPLSRLTEWWGPHPDGSGARHVFRRRITRYKLCEVLSAQDVPPEAFDLGLPADAPRQVERHLRWAEAVAMTDPAVWWVGERLGSLETTVEPWTSATQAVPKWRHGHPGPNDVESADLARPLASEATTEVVVHYRGPEGADLKISSMPEFDIAKATAPYSQGALNASEAVAPLTVGGRDAVILRGYQEWDESSIRGGLGRPPAATGADEGEFPPLPSPRRGPGGWGSGVIPFYFVVVDVPGGTVVVQGWRMREEDVVAAAAALEPVSER